MAVESKSHHVEGPTGRDAVSAQPTSPHRRGGVARWMTRSTPTTAPDTSPLLTRRMILGGLVALPVAAALAACGPDNSVDRTAPKPKTDKKEPKPQPITDQNQTVEIKRMVRESTVKYHVVVEPRDTLSTIPQRKYPDLKWVQEDGASKVNALEKVNLYINTAIFPIPNPAAINPGDEVTILNEKSTKVLLEGKNRTVKQLITEINAAAATEQPKLAGDLLLAIANVINKK